jgi:hypothetical protein
MHPRNIGRALGISIRVAGRIAGQRVAAHAHPGAAAPPPQQGPAKAPVSRFAQGQAAAQSAKQLATHARAASRGVGGFLRPFRRVGSILWLEVTGVFFLLPVIVFAPALWREGLAYSHTAQHRTFWVTALVMAVFLYLGLSSFWRARRR